VNLGGGTNGASAKVLDHDQVVRFAVDLSVQKVAGVWRQGQANETPVRTAIAQ
jgi:hypothetical protein